MSNSVTIEITETRKVADGYEFGDSGAYECITGWSHYSVDPKAKSVSKVVDIEHAPRNKDGNVEFSAELTIFRPIKAKDSNKRLFFDYGNRGNKRAIQYFNDAVASNDPISLEHCGNGYLFRRGYTIIWGAWQGDLLPGDGRMTMRLPIAQKAKTPITGLVRTEFIASSPGKTTFPLSGWVSTKSYPTTSMDTTKARLTRRRYPNDEREEIQPHEWCFARQEGGHGMDFQGNETSLIPSDTHIHIPKGLETGWIYELIYTGRDPLIMGLGHVAVRDLVSFLRYDKTERNPLVNYNIEKAYCFGRSQTGRCIRDAIYLGFNADADGRKVFDGAFCHVAGAGKMWLNHRFSNAIIPGGQQYEEHDNISDQFPFAYSETTDHISGKTDAICRRPTTDPLIFHTQTSTEYWQRRGSLVHTDTKGNDLPPPKNVRIYHWSSAQHVGNPLQGKPTKGICQNYNNVLQTSMLFRALLDAMDDWATHGKLPPENQIPKNADGTLVTIKNWRIQFPQVPGVSLPRSPNLLPLYDYGPDAQNGILTILPPIIKHRKSYAILIPAVDKDGNEIAGIRVPMLAAPLATYTGWNLRIRHYGEGAMHEFSGSTIDFPGTESERRACGDPRVPIKERFSNSLGYVKAIKEASEKLIDKRLMLPEDLARALDLAKDWCASRHDVRL
ncbi:MAG: hypothetical protein CMM58_07080 [Rhodospirillaceae bacterium]|nr:hypothetical protein [Rhodospirillaceae bacterium]